MIIAFKTSVDGVLLACSALKEHPECELIFAKSRKEMDRKLRFPGTGEDVMFLGFGRMYNTSELVKRTFKTNPTKLSPRDPGVARYIELALRHRNMKPAELVHMLAECKGDANHLYCAKTRLARRCYTQMQEVNRTIHSMCMFVRPEPVNGILTARIDPKHDVSDIFCRWLSKKNPDLPVAVICKGKAWVGNGELAGLDRFMVVNPNILGKLDSKADDAELEELWDVYYDSQMIESRRNKSLAKKVQPKYTGQLSKMAKKDRYKVERGIANCTLESFT